jgi:hypothetical protein
MNDPSDVDQHLDEYVSGELHFLSDRAKLFEKRAKLWYRIVGVIMALELRHSALKASTGSTRAARVAGM